MSKTAGLLLACAALVSTTAHADVSLNSVRVVARDAKGGLG